MLEKRDTAASVLDGPAQSSLSSLRDEDGAIRSDYVERASGAGADRGEPGR
jgi:hypothetical protein